MKDLIIKIRKIIHCFIHFKKWRQRRKIDEATMVLYKMSWQDENLEDLYWKMRELSDKLWNEAYKDIK